MTPRRILLIIIVCFLLYLFYCSNQSVFIRNTIHQRRTNFLLLGIDAVEGMLHSDTIIFVSYSSKLRQMDIVSIPRDTYVDVEEFKYRKIAEVFAGFYYKTKNKYKAAEILTTLVKEKILTSSTDTEKEIEIPYFLVIDYKSFEKLVDIVGKIKIFVEEPMHYDDYAGNLHIHFDPGVYYMTGKQALEYVRYRDSAGDIGRISRQQKFIKSFIKSLLSPKSIYKLPKIIYFFNKSFITNINLWEILNMMLEFKNLKLTNIRVAVLPGKTRGRYLEINKDAVSSFLKYINEDNNIYKFRVDEVLIKIYNATDKPRIAKQVAMLLRQQGYDVLDWGNWYCKLLTSKIIDCSHNAEIVNNLCSMLDIYDVTTTYSDTTGVEETTRPTIIIILGEDFIEKTSRYGM